MGRATDAGRTHVDIRSHCLGHANARKLGLRCGWCGPSCRNCDPRPAKLRWGQIAEDPGFREAHEIAKPPEWVLKKWRHGRGVVQRRAEAARKPSAK
eukprot:1765418-Alexandrium_andersonii.AAC.1